MLKGHDRNGTEEETREYRFDRETDTRIQAAVGMPIRQKTVHPANSAARVEDDFERETDALIKAASPAATFPGAISPARVLQRLPDFPLSHMSFLDLPLPPTTSATALASMSAVLTPDVFRDPPSLTKPNFNGYHQAFASPQTGNLHFRALLLITRYIRQFGKTDVLAEVRTNNRLMMQVTQRCLQHVSALSPLVC